MCPITSECGTAAVDLHCEFPFTIIPRCSIQREKSSSPYMEYLGTRIGEFQWQNPSISLKHLLLFKDQCALKLVEWGGGRGERGRGGGGEWGEGGERFTQHQSICVQLKSTCLSYKFMDNHAPVKIRTRCIICSNLYCRLSQRNGT